jgi:hypothetical protein
MLKRYSQCCSSQSMLCHTLLLHRLIPLLIKRSSILVSGGVVIVTKSVAAKHVAETFVAVCTLPESSYFLTSSD